MKIYLCLLPPLLLLLTVTPILSEDPVPNRRSERSAGNEAAEASSKSAGCYLSPKPGPCFGYFFRYFYDPSSMTCERFHYGGCGGNWNRFLKEQDCLQTCRTEAACRLPIVRGPCRGIHPRWAFDATQGKCITFQYGGCQGNGNHFYTEKECKEYCGVPTNDQ
ncbi:inter-alpha-trypsin inhibitor-like isoform X2 [Engystomops pustulosus]|uniref:inter-alpha-trypsin inhibitor-like isoform X2 n=1 Tax=Engystomops pustulosus TaxID=76066 RepID=UPI003AFA8AE5